MKSHITWEFLIGSMLVVVVLSPAVIGWAIGWRGGTKGHSLPLTCLKAWFLSSGLSALFLLGMLALVAWPAGHEWAHVPAVLLRVGLVLVLLALMPTVTVSFIAYFFAARRRAGREVERFAREHSR